jgi:class 3 adenylate cyclase
MKLRLNLFVAQLIGLVSILVLFCLGIMLAFYYTNDRALKNNEDLINEEIERNRLNQINILLSVARQAEKGFYAEQTTVDAKFLLNSLNNASVIVQEMNTLEQEIIDNSMDYNKHLFQSIAANIIEYNRLFEQSLILWKQRGYSRNSGLGFELRNIAYNGLRSHLSSYQTEIIQTHIYRLRWLEYEYYSYGKKYIPKLKKQIQILLEEINNAHLNDFLTKQLNHEIHQFNNKLEKKDNLSKHTLETHTHQLSKIIEKHTIYDFSLLIQTLLYYEMEYRELGQQDKHVQSVYKTLNKLTIRVNESSINAAEKGLLITAINQYQDAFTQFVKLDKKITIIKIEITNVFEQLQVDIDKAIKQEHKAMLSIQQKMSSENIQNSRINFLVTLSIVILAIFLVRLMVKRLGKKIKQIGDNLESISDGKLDITPVIPAESKRDELDWINYYVLQVSKSLSKSMGSLEQQNYKLKLVSSKLSKYLSPQVYQSIFSGQQAVHIQSKRKKLSIFFSDIVSFTSTTENMESEDLTLILNDYLNEMSKIALQYGGTIDKFIGDAIMIFFGDPESKGDKEDCFACVSMALAMRKKMQELTHQWKDEQGFSQPFKIRMGISSGYCTVGNFGSEERMDYTIIGGQVNLASRLESHAKPNQILISYEAYTLIKDKITCEIQDKIQAKGIAAPIQAYQVVDYRDIIDNTPLNFSTSGQGYSISIDESQISESEQSQVVRSLEKIIKKFSKE